MGSDHSLRESYSAQVRRVLVVTLLLNVSVALAKVVYGFMTHSVAMMSDGFHSLFDGTSNVIGLIGIWIASRPPDETHPYGHGKYETVFTIVIAAMLFATCFEIVQKVYRSFRDDHATQVTTVSFLIMMITMGVNIAVMAYERKKGRELGSEFLIADAKHTQSDILVSLAVIVSLALSRWGYRYADAIVGLIVTLFILRIGFEIVKDASRVLVDTVCISTKAIESVVNGLDGVRGCHDIRTRGSLNAVYLDLHVVVDRHMTTEKSHGIADRIEEMIKREFPSVVDIVVHVEPEMDA